MEKENKTEIAELNEKVIRDKIYYLRGEKVMLDFDLAEIYGYETKAFNQQVKRNADKFEDDFMFVLSEEETSFVSRSQNVTLNMSGDLRGANVKYRPHAFTEQGIYMLMTVLKGELATRQSKALIRMFKKMKDYIAENGVLLAQKDYAGLALQVDKNTSAIKEIKDDLQKVMDNFIDPDMYRHFLILNGQKVEADIAYESIYRRAKKSIYVIDNYISLKTLELLRAAKKGVAVTIFSDNIGGRDRLTKTLYSDFVKEYPGITPILKTTQNKCHDRYIILDFGLPEAKVYHCGASSKDAGKLITTIALIENCAAYTEMINGLLNSPPLVLN